MKLSSLHQACLQKILILQFLIFSALLFSQRLKTTLLFEKADVQENIVYKTDEKGTEILLDLYKPQITGMKKIPVVIFVHGGAWVEGNKTIYADNYIENTISKLLDKNFAVISINYRLVNESTHFPAPIEDTKDAVRWIRKNADQYQLDSDNIGMWGVSAGAHLSLLSAYSEDTKFQGDHNLMPYSAKVNYVVDNFGPTDMNRLLHTRAPQPLLFAVGLISQKIIDLRGKLIMGITGMNAKEDRKEIAEFCENISPLSYNKNTVPTLIIHGNKDKIAPLRHSKRLHKMLRKNDTENKFVIIKKGNHGFSTTDKAELEEISNLMVNFIIDQQKN
ncbi:MULTISPECIES: alpha/beta hydrolase [Chryseobacterium]|uniref:Acetyl esterase n=1 Tax=Chryseobacterium taihuense TaxID=1141221 RepID=A0A4U8WF24_9FLAO|nr:MULTISPECIES: alpha/beta hydrolase [Chryseobacterium]QQV01744.1 alpha/beta hydrolase [Chryseobacterium sp. FDAARGOS 1104]VFB05051.1 Acetyl esterase [Chryseobacterium taihuense]